MEPDPLSPRAGSVALGLIPAPEVPEKIANEIVTELPELLARHVDGRVSWDVLVAAGLAYFLAAGVLGNEQPFFAPVAAVVTLGLAPGERGRRAIEVALGVAVGLAVADVIVRAIGIGAVQITVVAAIAMAIAVLLGERRLLVNQAAISAILVVASNPQSPASRPTASSTPWWAAGSPWRSTTSSPEPGAPGREGRQAHLRGTRRRARRDSRGARRRRPRAGRGGAGKRQGARRAGKDLRRGALCRPRDGPPLPDPTQVLDGP
jgi:hypothetical protein